ncbi:hypothetical protein NEFER01_1704 [Nematocida sp. LUAm1]|nr:hypothetical protein NEFER02_1549 [Nematocida sp. LUAm2]KAI5178568.1 hypothetical protein NEFER01_1704 [Nematocida sp. LUAm1]
MRHITRIFPLLLLLFAVAIYASEITVPSEASLESPQEAPQAEKLTKEQKKLQKKEEADKRKQEADKKKEEKDSKKLKDTISNYTRDLYTENQKLSGHLSEKSKDSPSKMKKVSEITKQLFEKEKEKIKEEEKEKVLSDLTSISEEITKNLSAYSKNQVELEESLKGYKKTEEERSSSWLSLEKQIKSISKSSGKDQEDLLPESEEDKSSMEIYSKIETSAKAFVDTQSSLIKKIEGISSKSSEETGVSGENNDSEEKRVKAIAQVYLTSKIIKEFQSYYLSKKVEETPFSLPLDKILDSTINLFKNMEKKLYSSTLLTEEAPETEGETKDKEADGAKQKKKQKKEQESAMLDLKDIFTQHLPEYLSPMNPELGSIVLDPNFSEDISSDVQKCEQALSKVYDNMLSKYKEGYKKYSSKLSPHWETKLRHLMDTHKGTMKILMQAIHAEDKELLEELSKALSEYESITEEEKSINLKGAIEVNRTEIQQWMGDPNTKVGGAKSFMSSIGSSIRKTAQNIGGIASMGASALVGKSWISVSKKGLSAEKQEILEKGGKILNNTTLILAFLPEIILQKGISTRTGEHLKLLCKNNLSYPAACILWSKSIYLRKHYKLTHPKISYLHAAMEAIGGIITKQDNCNLSPEHNKLEFNFVEEASTKVCKTIGHLVSIHNESLQELPKKITGEEEKKYAECASALLEAIEASNKITAIYSMTNQKGQLDVLSKTISNSINRSKGIKVDSIDSCIKSSNIASKSISTYMAMVSKRVEKAGESGGKVKEAFNAHMSGAEKAHQEKVEEVKGKQRELSEADQKYTSACCTFDETIKDVLCKVDPVKYGAPKTYEEEPAANPDVGGSKQKEVPVTAEKQEATESKSNYTMILIVVVVVILLGLIGAMIYSRNKREV